MNHIVRCLWAAALFCATVPAVQAKPIHPLAIVTEGSYPDIRANDLAATIATIETESISSAWQVQPATDDHPADRIEWHFRMTPYASGLSRSIGPLRDEVGRLFGIHRKVEVEADLFLDGHMRAHVVDAWTVRGGAHDPALHQGVANVTQKLFAAPSTN